MSLSSNSAGKFLNSRSVTALHSLDEGSSTLMHSLELGGGDLDGRGKESVVPNFAEVANKNAIDWRKLFAASPDQSMQFYPPPVMNGQVLVSSPDDIFEEGIEYWKNAVIAQFIGRISNFSFFQKRVNVLWGEDGEVDFRPAGPNLFIIQFPNSSMRDRVLESRSWHIQSKPLIVRKWEP